MRGERREEKKGRSFCSTYYVWYLSDTCVECLSVDSEYAHDDDDDDYLLTHKLFELFLLSCLN